MTRYSIYQNGYSCYADERQDTVVKYWDADYTVYKVLDYNRIAKKWAAVHTRVHDSQSLMVIDQ